VTRARWLLLAAAVPLAVTIAWILFSKGLATNPLVDLDQPQHTPGLQAALAPAQPIGQTFVARHGGLTGIEFFLVPGEGLPQSLTLHLRADPQAPDDVATATLQLVPGATAGFHRFVFPALASSHGQYYYAFLEATPQGTGSAPGYSVALAESTSYLDGAAYQTHEPLNAQTTFRLLYAPGYVVLDLLKAGLGWLLSLVATGLLFVVPGWALLAWLWRGRPLSWVTTLALATGISLALYPIVLLWTDLLRLHLGPLYAWLTVAAGLAALVWRYRRWTPRQSWASLRRWASSDALWPDLMLALVIGLVFAVRLLVVRTLPAPMWGDSYHHTMIAQLLVDNGGLFDSWQPYVPLTSFTYHFGFHTAVALYHWLTGLETIESVIVVGQMLNGLAVLSLYPLAIKVGSSRWAGVLAILVAGLLSPMPMYYVNWGRYVQLAGQVILPIAAWLTMELLASRDRQLGLWILTAVSVAGLLLAHYRVTILYLLFLLVAWATNTFWAWRQKSQLSSPLFKTAALSLSSLILVLPWLWRLWTGYLPAILGEFARSQASATTLAEQNSTLMQATAYVPFPLLVVAGLGMLLALVRRERWIVPLLIWLLLIFLTANPHWLGFPGMATVSNFAGVLNTFTVLIGLYIPVSILCGYLGSVLIEAIPKRPDWLRVGATVAAILVLSALGGRRALTIVDTKHVLVTVPDVRAMQWIQDHTPETARFLANHFFAYEDNVVVGSDAGWWLPLLAQRENTVPPITYGHETATEPGYIARVNELGRFVDDNALDAPQTIDLLKSSHISYVYIGSQGGNLSLEALQASDAYTLVYHKDRVWIFEVR
jgi:hypothetical protein